MGFLPLAMGGLSALGGITGRAGEAKAQEANLKANAEAIRFSPWTHMATQMQQAQAPKGSLIGDIGAGVVSGMQQGQNMDAAKAQNNMLNSQKNYYDAQAFNSALPQRAMSPMQGAPGVNMANLYNKYQNQG